ncbi:MAG: Type III restriction-modification system methylation subunit, partial [uncultured Thermomicrobiales bacterium]
DRAQHPLLRRQPRHPPPPRPGGVGRPRLPGPALQLQARRQRALQGEERRGEPRPDRGVHRHLAVGPCHRADLRRPDRRGARQRRPDGLGAAPVRRLQRHDGLPFDDGGAVGRM